MNRPELDPQRLAALIDGRLTQAERAELLDRLGKSPEDLALLADVAAVQREEGVVPIESKRRGWLGRSPRTWLAIAAVAAGVALAPFYLLRQPLSVAGIPNGWNRDPWSGVRGGGGGGGTDALSDQERALRVGVRLTQLDVALRTGDPLASTLAADLGRLLASVPGSAPTVRVVERAAARHDPNAVDDARRGALALLDSTRVSLGEWTESARLAAGRKDQAFFTSAAATEALVAAGRVHDDAPPAAADAADDVRAAIDHALASGSDASWQDVGDALVRLIAALSL